MLRLLPLCLALLLAPAQARAAVCPAPFSVGGDPRVRPSDFRITTFRSGLDFPFGMVSLDDGSLLVGTSVPNFAGGGLFASTWRLRRLVDADGDGCADGAGTILFNGFAGPVTGLRRADSLVFVAAAQRLFVLRLGAMPADPLVLVGSLDLTFAGGWSHPTQTLAVRTAPGQTRIYQLLFNVGSRTNFAATTTTVPVSGLFTATLDADSLYMATINDAGPTLVVTGMTRLASGLRNAFGIAFQPGSGDLYFEDNGIDGLVDPSEPLSADELDRIGAAAIGGAVENFGFPSHYVTYRTGTVVGSGGILPLVAFQPVPPRTAQRAKDWPRSRSRRPASPSASRTGSSSASTAASAPPARRTRRTRSSTWTSAPASTSTSSRRSTQA
ncbi:MAG: hypothetical protein ACREKH_01770, partial [Candidatus Rokuibacteriota bacterium]